MNEHLNLGIPLTRLESNSLQDQAEALDEAYAIFQEFGRRVVKRFIECDDRFIIWERLLRFGPFVIDPLKEVLSHTKDHELRALSAMVLVVLGERSGVPILLDTIASDEELLCPAVVSLVRGQIMEAGEVMIQRLRTLEYSSKLRINGIQCLLSALKTLKISLPPDVIERFRHPDTPWEIQAYL